MRVAALISHPVQYYAPIFRELSRRVDLHVYFGQKLEPAQHAASGFGVAFDWDIDLLNGYQSTYLRNVARNPSPAHYFGCDTPDIARHLKDGRFDALIVAGWYQKTHAQAIWAAKRLGIPVLVRGDSHLSTPRTTAKWLIKGLTFPMLLRLFDAALYVGNRSRTYYEYYNYPRERLFRSPHCVDNDWFRERSTRDAREQMRAKHGISEETKVVLLAAKLIALKRPIDLIEAVSRLNQTDRDVVLMIAGSGPLSQTVDARARELSVRVISLGFCNQSKMPEVYAASDVLAVPSAYETWGLVANEALACGRPVVVSDVCGCAQDLEAAGSAVRTFPVGQIEALADCLKLMLDRRPSQSEIKRVSDQFDVKLAVDGIESAIIWCSEDGKRTT